MEPLPVTKEYSQKLYGPMNWFQAGRTSFAAAIAKGPYLNRSSSDQRSLKTTQGLSFEDGWYPGVCSSEEGWSGLTPATTMVMEAQSVSFGKADATETGMYWCSTVCAWATTGAQPHNGR